MWSVGFGIRETKNLLAKLAQEAEARHPEGWLAYVRRRRLAGVAKVVVTRMTLERYTSMFEGMGKKLMVAAALVVLAGVLASCGNGSGGTVRTVLVDYKHDDFASAFLSYYPKSVKVHPGDTVRFRQTWTGEPHSVTMGTVVDAVFKYAPIIEQYDSKEAALAGGVDPATITKVDETFARVPGMTDDDGNIFPAGAEPCYVDQFAEIPRMTEGDDDVIPGVQCPTRGRQQPAFTGKQALYNSGFIPFRGVGANTFEMPIAKNAVPGTYQYFCNYHWIGMSGTVTIVPDNKPVPSQSSVSSAARKQLERDSKPTLASLKKGEKRASDAAPLVGVSTGGSEYVSINEFLPRAIEAKVGKPVTWKVEGFRHTLSFNVPKYFPVLTVKKDGSVSLDKRAHDPVGWTVSPPVLDDNGRPLETRRIDVGSWDGSGGYHSSGLIEDGETFSLTFTKPGTYPYACVIHPAMIGQVKVT